MSMTMKREDRPKAIALVVAIIAIFAFIAFRFIGSAKPAANPQAGTNPAANLPSTSSIASGTAVGSNDQPVVVAENLHEVFGNTDGMVLGGNPFRMPVPQTEPKANATGTQPKGIGGPTQGRPDNEFNIGGDGFNPQKPGGLDGQPAGEGPQVDLGGLRIKGIITPSDGRDSLAFIQVGERGKGFRVGDEIAPGMKIVGITETKVSVKIGGTVANFGVGQEVKPS